MNDELIEKLEFLAPGWVGGLTGLKRCRRQIVSHDANSNSAEIRGKTGRYDFLLHL